MKDVLNNSKVQARGDVDHRDLIGHFCEHLELALKVITIDKVPVDLEVYTNFAKWLHVGSLKSYNFTCAHLACPVSAQELVAEEDAYLWNLVLTSYQKRTKKVVDSIVF